AACAATHEPGEPVHGGQTNGLHSVWWKWTAPANGRAFLPAITAAESPGIALGVYTGDTLNALLPVWLYLTNGPDTYNYSVGQPAFDALAGTTYFLAMDSTAAAFWRLEFRFAFDPWMPNDAFSNRQEIAGTAAGLTGDTFLASAEVSETNRMNNVAGKSVWWEWTAPADGVLRLNSAGSPNVPIMTVYSGAPLADLVFVATTLTLPLTGFGGVLPLGPPNIESNLTCEVQAGVTYQISADAPAGWGGGEFAIALDFCSLQLTTPGPNAVFLVPTNVSLAGTFVTALEGSLTQLDYYAGTNHLGYGEAPGFGFVWSNPPPGQYRLRAVATNGSGMLRESFPRQVAIGVSPNDPFALSIKLPGNFARLVGNNSGATREPGEPVLSGDALGRTLWWNWTASATGAVVLTVPTNAAFIPVMAVYRGTGLTNLELIASNSYQASYSDGSWSGQLSYWRQRDQLVFAAAAGETYYIVLDGYTHEVCDGARSVLAGELNVTLDFWLPPLNDDFATPTLLTGAAVTLADVNLAATFEAGEPVGDGHTNAHSVWYSWIPPYSGKAYLTGAAVRIPMQSPAAAAGSPATRDVIEILITPPSPCDFLGENPPAAFAWPVWLAGTGDTLTNLVVLAAGTNISFDVVAGQPVRLAASGPGDSEGAFAMQLQLAPRPVNDDFAGRQPLRGTQVAVMGTNTGATRESGEPQHGSDPNQVRSVWWTWQAPASGNTTVRAWTVIFQMNGIIPYSYLLPLATRVYRGNALDLLQPVTEPTDSGQAVFYANAGVTYQIAVVGTPPGNEFEGEFMLTLAGPPPPPRINASLFAFDSDGGLRLDVAGVTGQSFMLQASDDLVHWENLCTDTIFGSLAQLVDQDAAQHSQRFYRAVPLDSPLARRPLLIENTARFTDSTLGLTLQGNPGDGYVVEASTNLVDWIQVDNGIIAGSAVEWFDPDSGLFPARFYRLRPAP
ncbi:MAG TPA: hypothetical protein VL527_06020, partial [Dongiaceae bacterium]|nr:hypothetical protein [Dongiaceae bacterium]